MCELLGGRRKWATGPEREGKTMKMGLEDKNARGPIKSMIGPKDWNRQSAEEDCKTFSA